MYTVQVIDKRDGKPVEYAKVGIVYDGFFRGSTRDLRTDDKGEAHFDYDNGYGRIFVNGQERYHGEICGRMVVYLS